MVEIMKASAGSGKTFNLARKYITLLFKKPDRYAYRHILAVTFTNKATEEMKTRILKELYILASEPSKSGYLKYFMPDAFGPDELDGIAEEDFVRELPEKPGQKITLESLAECAEMILCGILHDYSAFAVSTIDKFFQQTLKAFSREIGQFASYKVELDKNSLVAESVDRVLDALTESDEALLKWLTDSVMENIEQGGRYNLESSLMAMASRLKSDEHREQVEKYCIDETEVYSKENLKIVRDSCNAVIDSFTKEVELKASAAIKILKEAGVDPVESNRKFLNGLNLYTQIDAGKRITAPTDSFMDKASDYEQWFAKSKAKKFLPLVYPFLEAPLNEFCAMFDFPFKVYNTALVLKGQLYGLGIAGELYREFNALMKEKNVLSIDDSNTILKGIIDGSDVPFVYEKLGVRYENFLLDEFQDTSRIQWENFKPLLHNSDSQQFDCLIVGDVKQSIYRWRGSDWNLFHSELQNEFGVYRSTGLEDNYRSLCEIVRFNNDFFKEAALILDDQYGDALKEVSSVYSDVDQNVPDTVKDDGVVSAVFCSKQDENAEVLATIRYLVGAGVPKSDIAVLVRNNSTGADIASYLIGNDVPVLTDDSLKVKSSVSVRRLASLLSYVDNPDDSVNGFLAHSMNISIPGSYHSIIDLCESLLREIRKYDRDSFNGEVLYIQSFMDYVQDYVSVSGNDLHGFLKSWSEADPAISSPSSSDSVRIMTIHKSKGLAFPYVIFPYVETVGLFRADSHWCVPNLKETSLKGCAEGLYDVCLSSLSEDTLFSNDYKKELKLQYVDNINTVYVAFTRAARGLFLIAAEPSETFVSNVESGTVTSYSDFSQILYKYVDSKSSLFAAEPCVSVADDTSEIYARKCFCFGSMPPLKVRNGGSDVKSLISGFPSWPLNGECPELGRRLEFRADASEFFAPDGRVGVSASARLRGIVLHDILASVVVPDDLDIAVRNAFTAGDLSRSEADEAYALLSERIASAAGRGWFPNEAVSEHISSICSDGITRVYNEVTLIDSDGEEYRPDRVIVSDNKVTVIDYKFGDHKHSYLRQIARYADLYRRMGYTQVSAYLWYVISDEVRSLDDKA